MNGFQAKSKPPKKFAKEKITLKDCLTTERANCIKVGKFSTTWIKVDQLT